MAEKILGNAHVKYSVRKSAIFLFGSICEETPKLLQKALNAILKNYKYKRRKKKVSVYIQSSGGLFYGAIKAHAMLSVYKKAKICTVAVGHADSCAMVILQAGDIRFAFSDATLGIHRTKISVTENPIGADILMGCLLECLDNDAVFRLILLERGRPENEVRKLFDWGDKILTAEEAKKLNLIDKILDPQKVLKRE